MDLCLSCKACSSECPSNVDMAGLKAEFLYQYYKANGVPPRARAIANISRLNKLGMLARPLANYTLRGKHVSRLTKKIMGVAPQRELPLLNKVTLKRWYHKNAVRLENGTHGKVYFFADEFTEYNDASIGITAI